MSRRLFPVGLLLLAACHHDASDKPETPPLPSGPVETPAGIVAEVTVRAPDALWGKLEDGVKGPLAHLPRSMAGALATAMKLDLSLAGEIDGAAPAYALFAEPGKELGWAVALKLRDEGHARATLLTGAAPHFKGRPADGELTVLMPNDDAGAAGTMFALSRYGYLVMARSEADLVTLAPYATRTLPSRPLPVHALVATTPHAALAGPLHDMLAGSISDLRAAASMLDSSLRQQHGKDAPDFGDPQAVIDGLDSFANDRLAKLGDIDHATLTLDATETAVDVEVLATPGKGASAKIFSSFHTGDASPLLTLGGETEAAILFRDDEASIADGAAQAEARLVAVLGASLKDKERAALDKAFADWAAGRGAWLTVAAELEGGVALSVRTPTHDATRATQAIADFVDLAHKKPFRDFLDARLAITDVSTATVDVAGMGSTSVASFRRTEKAHGGDLALAWGVAGDFLRTAGAEGAARALRATKDPDRLLGTDITLAEKLGALRNRASLVAILRPRALAKAGEPRPSAVFAVGRDKADGWGLLTVDDALLREALTRGMGP